MSRPDAPITVVTLDPPGYASGSYLLRFLQRHWEEQGLRFRVVEHPQAGDDAGVAVLHLDQTRVSDEALERLSGYSRIINGRVVDISKRSFSTQILQRHDDYTGPVIVKTDANCGGINEPVAGRSGPVLSASTGKVQHPWRRVKSLRSDDYPVFESMRAVPTGVWANPYLVVEKFLPERRGKDYCLRSWYFLGDKETGIFRHSGDPVVKSFNVLEMEFIHEVPDELREWRARLGFDYGKFDYGIVDGRVVLYDVNRTPTAGRSLASGGLRIVIDALRDGIHAFLR